MKKCLKSSLIIKLFMFATSQTYFMLNGNLYHQIDGVAVGSPLAPILANLFLQAFTKIMRLTTNFTAK